MTNAVSDIDKMTFEEALAELEKLSEKMSKGNLSLEESVEAYSRGARLRNHCSVLLKDAEEKVRKIDASMKDKNEQGSAPGDDGDFPF